MPTRRHTRWYRALWRAICPVAPALQPIDNEHLRMWELDWQPGRGAVPDTGPLTWVLALDGYRLAGNFLPAHDTRAGGTP